MKKSRPFSTFHKEGSPMRQKQHLTRVLCTVENNMGQGKRDEVPTRCLRGIVKKC